jgi:hypothetical protein
MASYIELNTLAGNSTLRSRIAVACVVAANAIRIEDPITPKHAERLAWAKSVYASPQQEASRVLWSVLAQNAALTNAQIEAATDVQIQTAVDAAIAAFL